MDLGDAILELETLVWNLGDAILELQTLYGFGGRHLRIRDICMEFGRPLTCHSLVITQ